MALRPTKLKETPHAAPDGAAVIDVDYVVVGGKAPRSQSFAARLQRAAVRFLLAAVFAAVLGAAIPPLLIAADMVTR